MVLKLSEFQGVWLLYIQRPDASIVQMCIVDAVLWSRSFQIENDVDGSF